MTRTHKLILASGSPRRIDLLAQAGIEPARLMPMDIDESPKKAEHPRSLAVRLALEKAKAALDRVRTDADWAQSFILSADTVVAVGRRVIPKAETTEDAFNSLQLLSGRSHRVYTAVCLITPKGRIRQRLVETKIRFKRLSLVEIESYLSSGQWRGKAGAYAIQGLAGTFVQMLSGSYTSVVGLPLTETVLLLAGEGFDTHSRWGEG